MPEGSQPPGTARWRRFGLASLPLLRQAVPGLTWMRGYQMAWLRSDVVAGMTVAAVILPLAMAYGQLAGLSAAAGIYASMLPLVAYAFFGTSRQLILGPDAASAALVAVSVLPLANGNAARYAALAAVLALITGLLCLAAGIARLGFIASFLSKPVLVGYINGLALTVVVGQVPKVLGIQVTAASFFGQIVQILANIGKTHPLTLAIGVVVLVVVVALRRIAAWMPGPLIAMVAATLAVIIWHLDAHGVATIGAIAPGLPLPRLPTVSLSDAGNLFGDAVGIALLTFSDTILNARTFAARQGVTVDANRELIGLGMADAAAGLSQGFPISASGSRTAVNVAAGGKTQLVSIVAAGVLALILLFLTGPLSRFPSAALGAILIATVAPLIDVSTLRHLARADWRDLLVSLVTLIGVLTVGLLQGIVLAIILGLGLLLARSVRPHDAVLVQIQGVDGQHDIEEYPEGSPIAGLLMYRFDAPLFFANADFFQRRVQMLIAQTPGTIAWFILDAEAITDVDSTAAEMMAAVVRELAGQHIRLVVARAKHPLRERMGRLGLVDIIGKDHFYPSVRSAVAAFEARDAS